jgi:hypothetical protein
MNPDDIDPDKIPLEDGETLYECADCGVRIISPHDEQPPVVTCPGLDQTIPCDWESLATGPQKGSDTIPQ